MLDLKEIRDWSRGFGDLTRDIDALADESEKLRAAIRWLVDGASITVEDEYVDYASGEYSWDIMPERQALAQLVRQVIAEGPPA